MVVGLFELIHSVDSLELAEEINRRAEQAGLWQSILLEINIGGEKSKGGMVTRFRGCHVSRTEPNDSSANSGTDDDPLRPSLMGKRHGRISVSFGNWDDR